jgi:hypothetical protein
MISSQLLLIQIAKDQKMVEVMAVLAYVVDECIAVTSKRSTGIYSQCRDILQMSEQNNLIVMEQQKRL